MTKDPKSAAVSKWETCRIEVREERRVPVSLFSPAERIFYRTFAIVDSPQGQKVIAWSGVWSQVTDGPEAQLQQERENGIPERTRLVERLCAQGWEPEPDRAGEVNTLRRLTTSE